MTALLERVVTLADGVFRDFGLMLNFSARKCEAVCTLRGPGATCAKRALFVDCLGCIPCPSIPATLRVVSEYQHLGTAFTQDASIQVEVCRRLSKALVAFRTISKPILRNRRIDVPVRLRLLDALVVSILFHGAGNWDLLNARSFGLLQGHILTWQRSIVGTGFWSAQRTSDHDFQAQHRLLPLGVRLTYCMLSSCLRAARLP